MKTARPHVPRQRRPGLTLSARAARVAGVGCAIALVLFVVHVFVATEVLRLAAIGVLSLSLVAVWVGVLAWRMPVFENRVLLLIGLAWSVATGLGVWIILWAKIAQPLPAWRVTAHGFALSLSLAAAGLFLRALLHKRTSPLAGRLLSLLSPLALLLWIVLSFLNR
ncbi:hypothetical protein ACFLR0_01235 [Candidatus Bipolaricaulota bacterium]